MAKLPYMVRVSWNGQLVAKAECTRVMAYDITKGFLADNFAGIEHRQWCDAVLHQAMREFLAYGQSPVELIYQDGTSCAAVEITENV